MRSRRTALFLTVAVLTAGCGGGGGGSGFGDGDLSVRAALDEIPALDDDAAPLISMADLDLATELDDLDRPAADAGRDEYTAWLTGLAGAGSDGVVPIFVVPPDDVLTLDLEAYRSTVGASFLDASQFVTASAPPDRFTVLGGVGDAELDAGLVEVAEGVVSNADRADYASDPGADISVDRLGRPVRFAQDDDRIAASLSTPLIEAWLAGDGETLGDDPSLVAVADALDDADVVSAALIAFPEPPTLDDAVPPDVLERLDVELPAAFTALGLGWAADDGEPVMTAVYRFDDDDTANEMVDVLERLFRDGTSLATQRPIADLVELTSIESDGELVVVTLSPGPDGRPQDLVQMVVRRDLPFVSA